MMYGIQRFFPLKRAAILKQKFLLCTVYALHRACGLYHKRVKFGFQAYFKHKKTATWFSK